MTNLQVPVWGYIIMGLGLAAFIFLLVKYILRNRGLKRPIFASPYILWIVIFTVVPCLLVGYYAFTKQEAVSTGEQQSIPRYTFALTGHKAPEEQQTLNAENKVEFPAIQYTAEDIGVHTYTITETDNAAEQADPKTYSFIVTVSDNNKGSVKVSSLQNWTDFRKKSSMKDNQLTFSGSQPKRASAQGVQYSYTLTGNGTEETVVCAPDETVTFPPIPFTHDNVGTYTYTIAEHEISADGETTVIGTYAYEVEISAKDEQTLKGGKPKLISTNFQPTKASQDKLTFIGQSNSKDNVAVKETKTTAVVFSMDNFKEFFDGNYSIRKIHGDNIPERLKERNSDTIDTLVFSLWTAFLCTIICLLLGYPAAHIMADREFKLGSTLVILFVVPMWMNFLLRTIALMNLMEDSGLINTVLEWLGIGRQKLLNNVPAILVGMVYNFLPFMVFPIYNALNKMDYKLSEAAMDLGCNKWKTFYKVTLPLSLPGVVSGITMVFMPAVTTFYISRLLGGGKVQLFGDLIEAKFLSSNLSDWNVGSAMSLIMMVLILLSLGLLQKVDPDGEGGGMV